MELVATLFITPNTFYRMDSDASFDRYNDVHGLLGQLYVEVTNANSGRADDQSPGHSWQQRIKRRM